jgi:adenosine deaminase
VSGWDDEEWLRGLPKAETHCHLETTSPELTGELAARRGVPVPVLAPGAPFGDLFPFLDASADLIATEEEASEVAHAVAARASESGVRHFEIIMNVSHWRRRWGGRLPELIRALAAGFDRAEAGGHAAGHLSVSVLRASRGEAAEDLVRRLARLGEPRVVALSIDGDESAAGFTGRRFAAAFRRARTAGLRTVAHTGESGGAAHVRDTLEHLAPDRIDHGFRAMEEPALARAIAAARIPLALCPSANVDLGWVESIETHPVERLRRVGAHVSINTDAPWSYVLWEEYARCRDAFGWSRRVLKGLAANSIDASFAPEPRKAALLRELERYPT